MTFEPGYPERLFGDESEELMRDHIDEFVVTDDNIVHHDCGWKSNIAMKTPLSVRGAVLRHLRDAHPIDHDTRIDPNPGGPDYKWERFHEEEANVKFINATGDHVTCGAFLSLRHPVRVKTKATECPALIPVEDLPCACPMCGQWKS